MALSVPQPTDAELATRVTDAVTELNAAIRAAAELGLMVVITDLSVQRFQDRFEQRVYHAEVLKYLTPSKAEPTS